jgi:hypothetical protein
MVQFLYDNNIIIYAYAALCGIGLLLRLIVDLVFRNLVNESDRLGETKNKMLRHMKMKFSTCYKLKIGVNNVDTFVDKSVSKYRFCGVLLSTWDNLCGQVLFLVLLLVPVSAVFGVSEKCGQDQVLLTGAVGILASAILILVDKSINLSGKKKLLRINLLDYLENFCKVRLEQEASHPELVEQYRREYFQTLESKQSGTAATLENVKEDTKKELNRRKEERIRKEEEKRLLAAKREEEQRKVEEARKEVERRKFEERRQLAAKRREEERVKMEEERTALEARREELKRKAEEKQQVSERKQKQAEQKEEILHSIEEELKPEKKQMDMDKLVKGVEEIAEKKDTEKKVPVKTPKNQTAGIQEEKLIEDVLKEFFA